MKTLIILLLCVAPRVLQASSACIELFTFYQHPVPTVYEDGRFQLLVSEQTKKSYLELKAKDLSDFTYQLRSRRFLEALEKRGVLAPFKVLKMTGHDAKNLTIQIEFREGNQLSRYLQEPSPMVEKYLSDMGALKDNLKNKLGINGKNDRDGGARESNLPVLWIVEKQSVGNGEVQNLMNRISSKELIDRGRLSRAAEFMIRPSNILVDSQTGDFYLYNTY